MTVWSVCCQDCHLQAGRDTAQFNNPSQQRAVLTESIMRKIRTDPTQTDRFLKVENNKNNLLCKPKCFQSSKDRSFWQNTTPARKATDSHCYLFFYCYGYYFRHYYTILYHVAVECFNLIGWEMFHGYALFFDKHTPTCQMS